MSKPVWNTELVLTDILKLLKEVSDELSNADRVAMRDKVDRMITELEEGGIEVQK